MHEVSLRRLKRRLADTENELQQVLSDVRQQMRYVTRRVEHLEGPM